MENKSILSSKRSIRTLISEANNNREIRRDDPEIKKTSNLIRRMVVGGIISEYAMIELKDNTHQELKFRNNKAIKSIRHVQDWFIKNPNADPAHKKIFEKEFLKGQLALLGELIETVWGLSEADMEELITQLKGNIREQSGK